MRIANEKLLLFVSLMMSSASTLVNGDQHSAVGTLLAAGLITLLLKGKHHEKSLKSSRYQHNLHGTLFNGFGYSHIPHILNIDNGIDFAYLHEILPDIYNHNHYLIEGNNAIDGEFISDYFTDSQVLTRKVFPYGESLNIGIDALGPKFGIHDFGIDGI